MKHFSRALIWLTASEIIFNIAGYVIQSVLGRLLGPADYGRYGLIVTLTTTIIILIGNGVPTAMAKYISEISDTDPGRILDIKHAARRLQIMIMGIVTIAFFLGAPFIAAALHDPSLTPLFQLSSAIIPAFAAASFYFSYYTGLHFFRVQAILKTLRACARIVCIIGLALFFGVQGAVSGYIAAPLIVFLIGLAIDFFLVPRWIPALRTRAETSTRFDAHTLLSYAWPLTVFLLFYQCILSLDLYFVKSMLRSDTLTGIYNATITASHIPYYLFYALTIVLLPAVSKSTAARAHKETTALVSTVLRLMVLILVPMITFLTISAPSVLALFYGPSYNAAALPMMIYAPGVGFLTVFYVLSFALNGAGLVKIPMKLSLWGFVVMLICNILLIPHFGLIGAATASASASFIMAVGILYAVNKAFRASLPIWTYIVVIFSTFCAGFIAMHLPQGPFIFIVSDFVAFCVYVILLRLCKVITPEDYAVFLRRLHKKPKVFPSEVSGE